MTQEAKQIEVRNVEAKSHGRRKFTPKQWPERFCQYPKSKNKMDSTELTRRAEMTQGSWTDKETEIQEEFIWGNGPKRLYQMTRAL